MEHVSTVLFDLDGTLTEPFEGITKSIQYALTQLGAPIPTQAELAQYIGPPLRRTFGLLLDSSDQQIIEEAMRLYRVRFAEVGLFENVLYDGIVDLLAALQSAIVPLYVVTAKPRIYALRIIEHFDLAQYFTAIYGAELDGRFDNKADLVGHLLEHERLDAATTVMVGDRREDVIAARAHGVGTIGVTYGYGSAAELREAGADVICGSPHELLALFQTIGAMRSRV
jgi:phosphoglycolate phosphatase